MAETTEQKCENCGEKGLLFCDNMFTDFLCKKCGATNLTATLPKLETEIKCKDDHTHDIRVARNNILYCVKCRHEIGTFTVTIECVKDPKPLLKEPKNNTTKYRNGDAK